MRSALSLSLLISLMGCATPQLSGAIPNFHEVDPGIYRGAQPAGDQFNGLKEMGIRTILKLNTENLDEERAAASTAGIKLVEVPLSGVFAPSDQDVEKALSVVEDPSFQPVYFHCQHGADRTGLLAALHRVNKDGWSPARAHEEWTAYGHSRFLFLMDQYFKKKTAGKYVVLD